MIRILINIRSKIWLLSYYYSIIFSHFNLNLLLVQLLFLKFLISGVNIILKNIASSLNKK